MTIGLDYTSRISPTALKAADVGYICRYIAPQAWKTITATEYAELSTAGYIPGRQLFLNWESDARDWLGGNARGTAHGLSAANMATALGYPRNSVIIGSCDFDAHAGDVTGYAEAFRDAVRGRGYTPGVYGPYNILDLCVKMGYGFFWQCMSTGFANNSHQHPRTNLWQKGHKTVGGQDCDWSQVISIPSGGNVTTENDRNSHNADWATNALTQMAESYQIWTDTDQHGLWQENKLAAKLNAIETKLDTILAKLETLSSGTPGTSPATVTGTFTGTLTT